MGKLECGSRVPNFFRCYYSFTSMMVFKGKKKIILYKKSGKKITVEKVKVVISRREENTVMTKYSRLTIRNVHFMSTENGTLNQ